MHRTTIVIAHKLATIRNADNIVVMSKGKIMEQGRHEELIARHGIYAELVHAQDLSPTSATEEHEAVPDGDSTITDDADIVQLPTKIKTTEMQHLASLKDREDHELYKKRGLLYSIGRLVANTPELKIWYLVTLLACTAGGKYLSKRLVFLY
jgi:ATP-binding cassette subfamily B (MDR/TAP) protein 1